MWNENANELGLNNQEKTKYLEINAKRSNKNKDMNVQMGQNNFEKVRTFSFLESVIYDNNVNSEEILTKIKK
jgi:hypothetical protein